MKEVKSLIQRAKRYLKSAELLIKEGDYESSVSRTYYAMFYSVEAILLTKGLSFSSPKGVISAFGEHFIKTEIFPKEMGRELNRAFEKRQIGDYEYKFVISMEEAKEILENGKEFIEKIIQYLKKKGWYKKLEMQNLIKRELIYPELSYQIVGILFEVYNQLGPEHHEKYYQRAIATELKRCNLSFKEQVFIPLYFKKKIIGRQYLDFLIEDKVILEIKKGDRFSKRNIEQISEYLKVSGLKLGILANFGSKELKFKRVVNLNS